MIEILPIEVSDILLALIAWGVWRLVAQDKRAFGRVRRARVRFGRWVKRVMGVWHTRLRDFGSS